MTTFLTMISTRLSLLLFFFLFLNVLRLKTKIRSEKSEVLVLKEDFFKTKSQHCWEIQFAVSWVWHMNLRYTFLAEARINNRLSSVIHFKSTHLKKLKRWKKEDRLANVDFRVNKRFAEVKGCRNSSHKLLELP